MFTVHIFTSTFLLTLFTFITFHHVKTKPIDPTRQGELEDKFLNRAHPSLELFPNYKRVVLHFANATDFKYMLWSLGGRGVRSICDGNVNLDKKIQLCTRVWNQLYSDELGDIITPEAEWKIKISNKCKKHQVVFKVLIFPPREEDAFHCSLSALKFNDSEVKPEQEFHLSPGSMSQPDSMFVLKDMNYDSHFESGKSTFINKKTKLSRLTVHSIVSDVGIVKEQTNDDDDDDEDDDNDNVTSE